MASIVLVDTETGRLSRYETGGSSYRLTHTAVPIQGNTTLTTALIENFRVNPPEEFSVEPPPQPPLPPGDVMNAPPTKLADLVARHRRPS